MGGPASMPERSDQAIRDGNVPLQDLVIGATVDAGKVDDGIRRSNQVVQRMVITKGCLVTRHGNVARISLQQAPQVPAKKPVRPCDPDAHLSSPGQTTSRTHR